MILEIFCWFLATFIVATILTFGACAIVPLVFNLAEFLNSQDAREDKDTDETE